MQRQRDSTRLSRRLLTLQVSALEFKGELQELCISLGIIIETNAPYIPEGNTIAERGFGTLMGRTRRLL